MTVGGAGAEKPAGMEGKEGGTAKPREFQWKEMPWNWVLIFFVTPTSKFEVQKQERVLVPTEELAGITVLIPWGQSSRAFQHVEASLAMKFSIKTSSYHFFLKCFWKAIRACRSRQSPLVPCLDCSAPTWRLRKGPENKRANEDSDIVTIDVVYHFFRCFSNFIFLPILVLFSTFDFDCLKTVCAK